MASVKLKFRMSSVDGRDGCLYYQVIHNRKVRQISTGYKIAKEEWDGKNGRVVLPENNPERAGYLLLVGKRVKHERDVLRRIIVSLSCKDGVYTSDDIVAAFSARTGDISLYGFMRDTISQLRRQGRERTAETYGSTLNSLIQFCQGRDILLTELDSDLLIDYEAHLKARGVTMNTVSFYMRILRAVYNRAVARSIMEQHNPFRHVYTGIEKTRKRAIPLKAIKRIKSLDLSRSPHLDFARDMFMFSFYTRGMSFVDMAFLRNRDLKEGILTYRRRKTGQMLCIKWEKCMAEIVEKYRRDKTDTYILPIIKNLQKNRRNQYKSSLSYVNRCLKEVARHAGLHTVLTMYVARHSWASIARSRNVPLSVISEGMGHDSEATTRIYLASLDTATVDRANNMILKLI